VNIGLVGCGRIAHIHMNAYKAIDKTNVVALCEVDINRARPFADLYKIDKIFSDYRQLFEIKDLDLIDICTPTSTHEKLVCEAAAAGVNVLVEKPMGRNSKECERMIEEARKNGTKICVCHNQLFFPHVKQLKSIANSGDFNMISFRTSHRENFEWLKAHHLAQPWNVNPEHGGILWEVGTHLAYLQLHFLEGINEVYALGTKARYAVWDDFAVMLRSSSNRWGIMEISWVAKESEIVYEIVSSDGVRVQTFLPHGYVIERKHYPPANVTSALENFFADCGRLARKWWKFTKDQIKKPPHGHFDLISAYLKSLENDSAPPVTGEDGRNAVRLLECIEESLNSQKPVKFISWLNR